MADQGLTMGCNGRGYATTLQWIAEVCHVCKISYSWLRCCCSAGLPPTHDELRFAVSSVLELSGSWFSFCRGGGQAPHAAVPQHKALLSGKKYCSSRSSSWKHTMKFSFPIETASRGEGGRILLLPGLKYAHMQPPHFSLKEERNKPGACFWAGDNRAKLN